MNYSTHRISDQSQITSLKKEMGDDNFFDYAINIYKYLAKMQCGERFDISKRVAKNNIDKFIKIACLYAVDFPGHIQFNDAFTIITKHTRF